MFDLFTPQFKACPFPTYATMRENAPVYGHTSPNGRTTWYITRHADVMMVLQDTDRFVKDSRHAGIKGGAADPINRNMLFADPPDHTRLRALVNQAFTPRRMNAMRPQIEQTAHRLLDQVEIEGKIELISQYALPLPVTVICQLLGVPAADHDRVAVLSQSIISAGAKGLSGRQRRQRMREFVAYLHTLFRQRQQEPQDDLITALVQAEENGDTLSEAELSSMVALLLVTGHETTVNLIGNSVYNLLQHPAALAQLRDDPTRISAALEELLRYDGPVETSTTRWAAVDLTLHGQAIKRGDVVRVVITSANRDPAVHEAADQLDIARPQPRHLQFGYGIHYCPGAPLARIEGEVAIAALLARFPTIALAVPTEQLRWKQGVLFRGLDTLPLTLANPAAQKL